MWRLHDEVLKYVRKKEREEVLTDALRYIWNLSGEEQQHIPIKAFVSSDSTYIHYENDRNTYFEESALKYVLRSFS